MMTATIDAQKTNAYLWKLPIVTWRQHQLMPEKQMLVLGS